MVWRGLQSGSRFLQFRAPITYGKPRKGTLWKKSGKTWKIEGIYCNQPPDMFICSDDQKTLVSLRNFVLIFLHHLKFGLRDKVKETQGKNFPNPIGTLTFCKRSLERSTKQIKMVALIVH